MDTNCGRVVLAESSFVARGNLEAEFYVVEVQRKAVVLHVFPRIASLYASFDEFQSV